MKSAINPNDRPLDLLLAAGAVSIPRNHPAYTGGSRPLWSHVARRWSINVVTIAGLLSIMAISGGAAHYLLRIAASAGEDATTPSVVAATIADQQPTAQATDVSTAELPQALPEEATKGPELFLASEVSLPSPDAAAPPAATKRPRYRSAKSARLVFLAQKRRLATQEIETVAFAPPEAVLPAAIVLPVEPVMRTPKDSR